MIRKWLHNLRYRTCSQCEREFRKHKVTLPSLVGYAYCSDFCERQAWNKWIKLGGRRG